MFNMLLNLIVGEIWTGNLFFFFFFFHFTFLICLLIEYQPCEGVGNVFVKIARCIYRGSISTTYQMSGYGLWHHDSSCVHVLIRYSCNMIWFEQYRFLTHVQQGIDSMAGLTSLYFCISLYRSFQEYYRDVFHECVKYKV